MVWRNWIPVAWMALLSHLSVVHATNVAKDGPRRSIMVVIGAAGEEEFGKGFRDSAERWRLAFQSEDFTLLDGTDLTKTQASNHQQQILDWIARPVDDSSLEERWLVLIGHGTHDKKAAKFNLLGPDISADAISKEINKVQTKWLIINGSSSSGPFINALSGPNRIIITGTKSGAEQNFTRFSEFLSQTIADPSTDLDHDDCVSILEAFLAASNRVLQFYENEGRLASEQALLDDNGDSRGTPAAFYRGARPVKAPANGLKLDGAFASRTLVSNFGAPDTRSKEQRERADSLAEQIEQLRTRKKEMDEAEYYNELERLFLAIATTQ